ncbi:hypothetical protein WJX77_003595 [Trebouxia sp. C0004]
MYVARRAGETLALSGLETIHKETLNSCCEDGAYTGLLVLLPKCLLHVVEADSRKLVPILHALHLAGGIAQLQDIKVISSTDNVPFQLFRQWQVTNINRDCKDQHEGVDPSLLVQTASALNIGCVHTAIQLEILGQKQSSAEISSQQAALLSSWATPETILALTYTEALPTLQEYLHLFDGAISSTLDSERTWPPHAPSH